MSKVSVIVAVYNGAQYIPRCLEYLDAQTHRDLDIMFVVDAKTTDGSVDLLRELSKDDDRVRIIIQNDTKRQAGARNIGLDNAVGEYVWVCDVDDRPYPTLIEDSIRASEENDAEVVSFNSVFTRNIDHPEPACKDPNAVVLYSGIDAAIALGNGELSPSTWSDVYRMDFLRENSMEYSEGLCEDLDFAARAFLSAERVAYLKRPLYVYYQNAASVCGTGANDDGIAAADVHYAEKLSAIVRERYPERYPEFCAAMGRHVIRSLTRASRERFDELSGSPIIAEMLSHCRGLSPEVILFKVSPGLFHRIGSKARGRKFSRDPLYFRDDF